MPLCPIAHWKQQHPEKKAFFSLTYQEFDLLIQKLCNYLKPLNQKIFAFTPKNSPLDIAFFFAAWRLKKAVYPLNFRFPSQEIEKRIAKTDAQWIDLSSIPLSIPLEISTIDPTTHATLIETSSRTKIACHYYQSHMIAAKEAIKALTITPQSKYCLNLPLFHISGIASFLRCFTAGATLLFPEDLTEATHVSMVPTQLYRLVQTSQTLPNLNCLLLGGAPIPDNLYQKALSQNLPIYLSYGMTETASMVAVKSPSSSTKILPHIKLKIAEDGEILLKGPSLFFNYFGENIRNPKDWFPTKDIGLMDKELKILGRKDRQFISGGENIQPEEIEKALLQIPGILEAHVSPKPDEEFGACPIASLSSEKEISLVEIQKSLEKRLPRFKIPKEITFQSKPFQHAKLAEAIED